MRGVTRGSMRGMEGGETGRSMRPRRSRRLDTSMLELKLDFGKCFARRNETLCIRSSVREKSENFETKSQDERYTLPRIYETEGFGNEEDKKEKEGGCKMSVGEVWVRSQL